MFLFNNPTQIKQTSIEFERKRTFLYFSKFQNRKIYTCLLDKKWIFIEGIVKYIVNGEAKKNNKIELLGGYFTFKDEEKYNINSIYALSFKKFSEKEMVVRDINTCIIPEENSDADRLLISSRDLKPKDPNVSNTNYMLGNFEKYNDKFYKILFSN